VNAAVLGRGRILALVLLYKQTGGLVWWLDPKFQVFQDKQATNKRQ
jgi:hypothetical protein